MMKPIFSGKFNNLSWKTSGSFDQSFSIPENVINLLLFIVFYFSFLHICNLKVERHTRNPWVLSHPVARFGVLSVCQGKNDGTKSIYMIETGTKIQINIKITIDSQEI